MIDESEIDESGGGSESPVKWTMAVQSLQQVNALWSPTLEADEVWVLWDSGSDEHLCSPKLAKLGRPVESKGQAMMDVQGRPILDKGATSVKLHLSDYDEVSHPTSVEFRIGDVNDHVMSASKVISKKMFRAILDSDGSYLQRKDDENVCVPLSTSAGTLST